MKRTTVEECSRLSIFELRKEGALRKDGDEVLHGNGQELPLTKTRCHFGGFRWWFICPGCGKRVGILYRPRRDQPFLCRHCHNLTYTSAQERRTSMEWFWKQFRISDKYIKTCEGKGRKGYSKRELRQMAKLNNAAMRLPKFPPMPVIVKKPINKDKRP